MLLPLPDWSVEKVSGEPWADYVERNIFKPLGMDASSVDKNVAGLAVPYGRRMPDGSREVLPFVDARGMAAATGVTSNVEDLAKFVSALFRRGPRGGRQIVSGGSWREMLRVRSVEEDWTSGTGLGFDVKRVNGKTYVGHTGGYPGNATQTLIQLGDKVGIIVLTNTNDSNPADIAQQLMTTVGEAVAKAAMTKAANARLGSGVGALRGAVSRPLGGSAGRAAQQEAGPHRAERAEPRRSGHARAARRRTIPCRGTHGRRGRLRRGGRDSAIRGAERTTHADVRRRHLD